MFKTFCTFFVTLFSSFLAHSFNPYTDLKGSTAVATGVCSHKNADYECFIVSTKDKFYIVIVAQRDIVAVYRVASKKDHYKNEDAVLIWEKQCTIKECI